MKTPETCGLVVLSVSMLAGGDLLVWLLFPRIVERLGGVNWMSVAVVVFLVSSFLLPSLYALAHARGKSLARWKEYVAETYVLLGIFVALGFALDSILPNEVPLGWRYFFVPLALITVALYLLRMIPRVRKKLGESSRYW